MFFWRTRAHLSPPVSPDILLPWRWMSRRGCFSFLPLILILIRRGPTVGVDRRRGETSLTRCRLEEPLITARESEVEAWRRVLSLAHEGEWREVTPPTRSLSIPGGGQRPRDLVFRGYTSGGGGGAAPVVCPVGGQVPRTNGAPFARRPRVWFHVFLWCRVWDDARLCSPKEYPWSLPPTCCLRDLLSALWKQTAAGVHVCYCFCEI